MNEILKKIEELIEFYQKKKEEINRTDSVYFVYWGKELALEEIKKIIQAEQKEDGCYICNDTSNDRYYKNQEYKYCPHCGVELNKMDVTDTDVGKIKTKGDLIRESNESLFEFLHNDECYEDLGICSICNYLKGCNGKRDCKQGVIEYLNQPAESEGE